MFFEYNDRKEKVEINSNNMRCYRTINGRIYFVNINIGSVEDMLNKLTNLSKMEDYMFVELAKVTKYVSYSENSEN